MDKDILRPTPQIWDAVAEDYTIELADSDRELASEIMRVFQKNGINPGARLLELGSGSVHGAVRIPCDPVGFQRKCAGKIPTDI